jgi:hypothetical protein
MSRTVAEIIARAEAIPRETLLAVTCDEVSAWGIYRWPPRAPLTLFGRPAIIVDLPPGVPPPLMGVMPNTTARADWSRV